MDPDYTQADEIPDDSAWSEQLRQAEEFEPTCSAR